MSKFDDPSERLNGVDQLWMPLPYVGLLEYRISLSYRVCYLNYFNHILSRRICIKFATKCVDFLVCIRASCVH